MKKIKFLKNLRSEIEVQWYDSVISQEFGKLGVKVETVTK